MKFRYLAVLLGAAALAGTSLATGGAEQAPVPTGDPARRLGQIAEQAAYSAALETIQANEIEMIAWRRRLMGRPGLQLFVIFFNEKGQPVEYFVTDGKCSSANKRLIKPWKFVGGQTGTNSDGAVYGDFVFPAASEDGTFGESDDYVYCKTADGKYKQWSGKYYISDAPIELTIKPLVIDFSGRNQSQQ